MGTRSFLDDLENVECEVPVGPNHTQHGHPACARPVWYTSVFKTAFSGGWENRIDSIIAIDQVAQLEDDLLYAHYLSDTSRPDALIAGLEASSDGLIRSATEDGLPPSPLSTFALQQPSVNGVVISGYNRRFVNPYYHSQFDTLMEVGHPTHPFSR